MIKEHSFVGGLNTDNTLNAKPEGTLSDAMNISIFTESGNSTLSVQNIKGNTPITLTDAEEGYDRTDYVIVAIEAIRNDFIVFWANIDNTGYGIIDKLIFDNELEFTRVELYKSISEQTNLDLIPNTKYAIETDYVDSETIRVHITSDTYPLRIFNVGVKEGLNVRSATSYNLKNFDSKAFNRLVDELLVEPTFVRYTSGNLLNGSYQYAYRLLSKNGSYSLFSVGSDIIPVSPTGSSGSRLYVNGADTAAKEISGLGIECSIDMTGIDTTYIQRIEIISLYYDSKFGTPTINIIESIDTIPTTILSFTDETNEAKYGTLTYLELTASSSDLSMRSLASKDGSLFGQYVTENYFDIEFDARAYQFDIDGVSKVLNANVEKTITSTGNYPEATFTIDALPIVETADVINPDRDIYKYDKSGELGGEGLHVKYSFIKTPQSSTILTIGDKAITKGYKQGEIYRFAIVFFDKGLASPAHWIGDIKIPDYQDLNSGTDTQDLVQVNFVVNTAGTDAWGKSFQIVYQEVTDVYRTILAEGLLVPIVREVNENTAPYVNPYPTPLCTNQLKALETSSGRLLNIAKNGFQAQTFADRYYNIPCNYAVYTPEVSLTRQFNLKSNLKIALIGEYLPEEVSYTQDEGATAGGWIYRTNKFKPTVFVSKPIQQLELLRYKSSVTLDGLLVRSVNDSTSGDLTGGDADEWQWISSTCLVLKTEAGLFDGNFSQISYPAVRIYRDSDPYGGVTYNDRELATYLPATGVSKSYGSIKTTKGDVSSSTFECFRTFLTENGNYTRNLINVILFPIQSVYNADYRYDKSFYNGGGNLGDNKLWPHFLQEIGNVTGDLYKYDDAYSAIDRSKIYVALNDEFRSKIIYDTRVVGSDKSTDDRYVNSWAIFKPNNFLKLRGNCGECTSLVEFNDTLYSFQDNGFSVISINPRVTQVGQDGIETVLGTGTLLERAIYGSTEIGTSKHSDIVKSVQAIYFLDQNKKKLYRISGDGLESLSDTRGIESYLANTITHDSKLIGIYDNARKAVYLTVSNNTYEYDEDTQTIEYTEDVTTINVTTEYTYEYTPASSYLTCEAIAENATVELSIESIPYTFTCVSTVVDVDAEFQYNVDVLVTLANLRTAIINKLTTLGLVQYYELILNENTLNIKSLRIGEEYNLEPVISNPVVDTLGNDASPGLAGYRLIKDTTAIAEDNVWVVIDFSTAGGVDRIDLLKNGSIVAQSGVHQGSNYGFPDAELVQPKIVDRDGIVIRELWQGQWNSLVAYLVGDIVKIVSGATTDYYLAITNSTNAEPSVSPTNWKLYSVGDFNTDDWASDPVYDKYCYKPHFIGTNSYLVGGAGTGSDDGLIPTRYEDFLNEVGIKSEDWLGLEGEAYGAGLILDGVVSRYNGGGYPALLRGQRVWAKYNTGDTYKIEAMGAGASTGYTAYYWVIKPAVSNLTAIDNPSTEIEVVNIVETTTTTTETISKTKTVTTIDVLTTDNRMGLITFVTGTTYLLSGITDLFVLAKNVDYNFNGAYYNVVDIDYENKVVELVLIEGEGPETSEEIDLTRVLKFRNPFTITFNEMLNKFDSFHSFIPLIYTKNFSPFYTINNDSEIFKHNFGNFGEYYGVKYNSYIDVVLPIKDVSRFTNASFYFWVSDGSERIPEKTLRSIKVFSDGQESDEVILYPKSYDRYIQDDDNGRLPNNGITITETIGLDTFVYPYSLLYNTFKPMDKMWRVAIPRIKEGVADFSASRAHGSYCIVRLEMDNTDNYKQVLDTLRFKFNTLNSFEE